MSVDRTRSATNQKERKEEKMKRIRTDEADVGTFLEIWDERVRVHCSTFLDASSNVVRSRHCQDEQDDRK